MTSPRQAGRISRLVTVVGLVVGSVGTLVALLAMARRCGDGCVPADSDAVRSWRDVRDSGEWTGQFLLSLGGLGLLLVFVYLRPRKPEAAWMMLVLSVTAYTAWTVWVFDW
jgi:hypothetical protein